MGGPGNAPWSVRLVALGIALVAVAALIVSQIIVTVTGTDNPAFIAWITSIALGVVIFAVVWFIALRSYRLPIFVMGNQPPGSGWGFRINFYYREALSALGLRPLGVPRLKYVGLTLGALLLSLGATALYAAVVRLAGVEILVPPEIPRSIVLPGPWVVVTFLALALWTPLSEEVFFRGFIFAGLSARWGTTAGMIISAGIFSVFHISLGVLIPIFITGLLLAWLYRQTGSLWASIAAHAGQNATALAATIYGI